MLHFQRRTRRIACAVLLASAAAAASASPVAAQFAVYDPANHASGILRYGQLILQARQMVRQVEITGRQANHIIQQARGFSIGNLRIPSIRSALDDFDRRFGQGVSLGYGNSRVDDLFRRTFPQAAEWNHRVAGDQAAALRALAHSAVMSTRGQFVDQAGAQRRLDELKVQMASAQTEREVAQIQGKIAAQQLDQQLLQQRTDMATANLQAADLAFRAGEAGRQAMRDTAEAEFRAYQGGVQEFAARRAAARMDSIEAARGVRSRTRH